MYKIKMIDRLRLHGGGTLFTYMLVDSILSQQWGRACFIGIMFGLFIHYEKDLLDHAKK